MENSTPADLEQPQAEITSRIAEAAYILPLILLLVAVVSLLFLQSSKTGFESNTHHGWLSSHGIALAKNLVAGSDWFFMYTQKHRQADGSISYAPYNPFPVFSFLITGLFIRPFEPNLAMQVMAARQLMNLFFGGAMLLCFLLTRLLLHNPWQALTVTLLAFSSHYMLIYNDMIFNDVPALFGCMLALYMIVKIESGAVWNTPGFGCQSSRSRWGGSLMRSWRRGFCSICYAACGLANRS